MFREMKKMRYQTVVPGIFCSRPNRFIALVETDGRVEPCHVKITGRCRELLLPGGKVYLALADNPKRKTRYDLIAVQKGDLLINMDSQSPNAAVAEALQRYFPHARCIRPEYTLGCSRFDFYVETAEKRYLIEVKGVTLEQDGKTFFPDAPTLRGRKHLHELTQLTRQGYTACIVFVIQMEKVCSFSPNGVTDPAFANALKMAADSGVHIACVSCRVTPNSMTLDHPVPLDWTAVYTS